MKCRQVFIAVMAFSAILMLVPVGCGKNKSGTRKDNPSTPLVIDGPPEQVESVKFFGEEIEAVRIVYLLDKSGSMNSKLGRQIVDYDGNAVENPTKMVLVINEFKKSVSDLPEGVEFTAAFYSAVKENGICFFSMELVMATEENKKKAREWADGFAAKAEDGTPTKKAVEEALEILDMETILLYTDGVPTIYPDLLTDYYHFKKHQECADLTRDWIIPNAKDKDVRIYTFGHLSGAYGEQSQEIGRKMLQEIAAETDGTYTEVE